MDQHSTVHEQKLLESHELPKSAYKTRNGRCFHLSTYTLLYVIMIGSVVFNGLMYAEIQNVKSFVDTLQKARHPNQAVPEKPEVRLCVSCDFFAFSRSEKEYQLQNYSVVSKAGEENCCVNGTNGQQVKELITTGVKRQLQREKAKGEFGAVQHVIIHQHDGKNFTTWKNTPVAHLLGHVRDQKHIGGEYDPQEIRRWLIPGEHRNTILKNGLTYRDGRIIISTEGLYYVYSQVLFIQSYVVTVTMGEQPEQDKYKHRCHYIYRYSLYYPNNGEDELLRGRATKCWSRNKEFGEYTSYLGGVFYLRPGDELFVKVSNISEVSRLALSNNFGLYML